MSAVMSNGSKVVGCFNGVIGIVKDHEFVGGTQTHGLNYLVEFPGGEEWCDVCDLITPDMAEYQDELKSAEEFMART